ncbi:hypothetical protein PIB30_055994 [Stylosanthes scabra]|uniref:RRM domain-containing protein n=1 Tax=Stylosanthes scabra TaxID=79078 RepID=A0ABU6XH43_9FABA|nr:hypothetical protein [Stylosanthes scabra]
MEPLSGRRILTRKILRKRFLLHLLCLWTSIREKDYLRYIKELKHRPELSLLRSRQASVSDLPRRQLIDGLTVITLRVIISLELATSIVRPGKTVIDRRLDSVTIPAVPRASRGCASLKYETKEQALAALEAINGKQKMEVGRY